jgi:hypothetical protein
MQANIEYYADLCGEDVMTVISSVRKTIAMKNTLSFRA